MAKVSPRWRREVQVGSWEARVASVRPTSSRRRRKERERSNESEVRRGGGGGDVCHGKKKLNP